MILKNEYDADTDDNKPNTNHNNNGGNNSAVSTSKRAVGGDMASATTATSKLQHDSAVKGSNKKAKKQLNLKEVILDGVPVTITAAAAHNLSRANEQLANKVQHLSNYIKKFTCWYCDYE